MVMCCLPTQVTQAVRKPLAGRKVFEMVVRIILTLVLIVLSYRETGVFTALSLFLIFLGIELQGFLTKRALDGLRALQNSDSFTNPSATRK